MCVVSTLPHGIYISSCARSPMVMMLLSHCHANNFLAVLTSGFWQRLGYPTTYMLYRHTYSYFMGEGRWSSLLIAVRAPWWLHMRCELSFLIRPSVRNVIVLIQYSAQRVFFSATTSLPVRFVDPSQTQVKKSLLKIYPRTFALDKHCSNRREVFMPKKTTPRRGEGQTPCSSSKFQVG